uniref:Uncharacterized protein n=1 Tax=Triticum urartu TaxID=4572 RepID=A0A8R7V1Z2_TRIUA
MHNLFCMVSELQLELPPIRHASREECSRPPLGQKKHSIGIGRQPSNKGAVAPPRNPLLISSNSICRLQISASSLLLIHPHERASNIGLLERGSSCKIRCYLLPSSMDGNLGRKPASTERRIDGKLENGIAPHAPEARLSLLSTY